MDALIDSSIQKQVDSLKRCTSISRKETLADQLSDLLDQAISNMLSVAGKTLLDTINVLMTLALSEADRATRESLLHALVSACSLAYAKGECIEVTPVVRVLDQMSDSDLEYALYIIGFSGQLDLIPKIKQFLTHPSCQIRSVAEHAHDELVKSSQKS